MLTHQTKTRALRRPRLRWYASIADADIFLSTLVLGEIRKDIELARARNAGNAAALERWLRDVEAAFDGRVLGIDNSVSSGGASAPSGPSR
ncbi:hypothetical protein PMI42_04737 [Bradyrhizobium sp. YR681]|uniref:hypothetical protein n=1 Tax=Bradyrhizobium sp. YR681 TaxID=1144344 RepID=UPI000270FDEF|nr:hypothetical protein [Bradyrhizobium sp. YR681]EJN11955.1 hypothetical protein PMI42_04737 [Bradyrhizobium sp. YR681]